MPFATNRFSAPFAGVKLVADNGTVGGHLLPSDLLGVTYKPGSGIAIALDGTISTTGPGTTTPLTGVSIDGSTIVASPLSPYQMATADRVIDVNKTNGAATRVVLPASPTLWVEYTIIDGKGDAGTNNITIGAASGTTINGQSSFVMNANNDAITLRAVTATTWRVC